MLPLVPLQGRRTDSLRNPRSPIPFPSLVLLEAKQQWTRLGFTCLGSLAPSSANGKQPLIDSNPGGPSVTTPPLHGGQELHAGPIGGLLPGPYILHAVTRS